MKRREKEEGGDLTVRGPVLGIGLTVSHLRREKVLH
jgi:hypothetical protein